MLGAIIGDIVGSRFEFHNHKSKEFEFFTDSCTATDDSIMTLAVAKAIMETHKKKGSVIDREYLDLLGKMTAQYMQEIGRKYPDCGYGGMFARWVFSDTPKPYNSFGNGAAMRISPAGFTARSEAEAIALSKAITEVTHNHPEGIKGAEAVTIAIYMARKGFFKDEIRQKIQGAYYPLNFKIDEIRNSYKFNETCQDTVPQAIEAFLESKSYEDAIRNAISVGGDSDTLAAITGAIAEAYYGIPNSIKEKAITYLDDFLIKPLKQWRGFISKTSYNGRFRLLTKYVSRLTALLPLDKSNIPTDSQDEISQRIDKLYISFEKEFLEFVTSYSDSDLSNYREILKNNNITPESNEIREADINILGSKAVLALITCAYRIDHFSGGAILKFYEDGSILRWLNRLMEIDQSNTKP